MADTISISCAADLSNFFSRSQNHLGTEFGKIKTIKGVWEGRVKSMGQFPLATGFAARHTVLGDQRINQTTINFVPMVGHQDDCVASCNSLPQQRVFQAVDHRWYRVMSHSEYTKPFCLKTMVQEAFELNQQVQQQFDMLKGVTMDINDEFSRSNVAANSDNHWIAVDDGTSNPYVSKFFSGARAWRFASDANGNINVNKVILNSAITNPAWIGNLTVETLNRVRTNGMYNGAFMVDQQMEVITDYDSADYLVKLDSNQRMDNRWRDPGVLEPKLGVVKQYANYTFSEDPFCMRYFWDTSDPNYPNGVLTRINPWDNAQVSEGCFSEASEAYLNADFQISIPYNGFTGGYQTMNYPPPPNQTFGQPFSPYDGMWTWQNNKADAITPCNIELNLGYWYMVWEMAYKPDRPQLGHLVLHRRPYTQGVIKSCRSLTVPVTGSYSCFTACPPYNFWPPTLVTRQTCGKWNSTGVCTGS